MAANDPVTAKQFNEFVQTLVKNLNDTHEYIYKRLDTIDEKVSNLDANVAELCKKMSQVQSNVSLVKKDTSLLPPISELLEEDGKGIATLRTKAEKLEN